MGFIGNLFGAVADEFVLSRIESDESEGSVGKCGTCYDGELNASFSELFKDIPGNLLGGILSGVILPQHEHGFRNVGKGDVRFCAEACHFLSEGFIKAHIEIAVIGHCGIYDLNRAVACKCCKVALYYLYLPEASEVSRVEGVKPEAFLYPVIPDGLHVVSKVTEGEALKLCVG